MPLLLTRHPRPSLRASLWQCLFAAALALPAGFCHSAEPSLDALLAQRLAPDMSAVIFLEQPVTMSLSGTLEHWPHEGKTTYMREHLALRGWPSPPAITHKLWLTTPGSRAMFYLSATLASQIQAQCQLQAPVRLTAMQWWNSRHGPGLLATALEACDQ